MKEKDLFLFSDTTISNDIGFHQYSVPLLQVHPSVNIKIIHRNVISDQVRYLMTYYAAEIFVFPVMPDTYVDG